MEYRVYSDIATKVRRDLGMEQETFISDAELMGYCNDGIDEAEAEIHTIYEDYFLTNHTFSLVSGTQEYDMPSDVYASKIRGVIYSDGNDIFNVRRMGERRDKFEEIARIEEYSSTDPAYAYILKNDSATNGIKLYLIPEAKESLTDGIKVWYIRNANRITTDTDECDIPEFVTFVIQFMKTKCLEKEGNPGLTPALERLERLRRSMVSTLSDMVPDGDNEIEKDMTFYTETVGSFNKLYW